MSIAGHRLVYKWLLQYSLKRGYAQIINEYEDKNDLCSIEDYDISKGWILTYTLRQIVLEEKFAHFPLAIDIVNQLFKSNEDVIPVKLHDKLVLGLKILTLFHLLIEQDKNTLAKTLEYFPRQPSSLDEAEPRRRRNLKNVTKNFRELFIRLIANKSARKCYLRESYHKEYRSPLPPRLKQLTHQLVELIHEKLAFTDLELIMNSAATDKVILGLEGLENGAITLLLDKVLGTGNISQSKVKTIIHLLRDSYFSDSTLVQTSVARAILHSSSDEGSVIVLDSSHNKKCAVKTRISKLQNPTDPPPSEIHLEQIRDNHNGPDSSVPRPDSPTAQRRDSQEIITFAEVHPVPLNLLHSELVSDGTFPEISDHESAQSLNSVRLFEDIPHKNKRERKRKKQDSRDDTFSHSRKKPQMLPVSQGVSPSPSVASSVRTSPFPVAAPSDSVSSWLKTSKPKKEYGRIYRMMNSSESQCPIVAQISHNVDSSDKLETDEFQTGDSVNLLTYSPSRKSNDDNELSSCPQDLIVISSSNDSDRQAEDHSRAPSHTQKLTDTAGESVSLYLTPSDGNQADTEDSPEQDQTVTSSGQSLPRSLDKDAESDGSLSDIFEDAADDNQISSDSQKTRETVPESPVSDGRLDSSDTSSVRLDNSDSDEIAPPWPVPPLSKHLISPHVRLCVIKLHQQSTVLNCGGREYSIYS